MWVGLVEDVEDQGMPRREGRRTLQINLEEGRYVIKGGWTAVWTEIRLSIFS